MHNQQPEFAFVNHHALGKWGYNLFSVGAPAVCKWQEVSVLNADESNAGSREGFIDFIHALHEYRDDSQGRNEISFQFSYIRTYSWGENASRKLDMVLRSQELILSNNSQLWIFLYSWSYMIEFFNYFP